jgi:predicted DNA-binding protein
MAYKDAMSKSCLTAAEQRRELASVEHHAILYTFLQNCRGFSAMSSTTQVSAYISAETKAEVEAYVKRRGVKKAYLIEEALRHHLQALREIPEDLIIPSRLVLTEKAIAEIADRLKQENEPTEALTTLFGG